MRKRELETQHRTLLPHTKGRSQKLARTGPAACSHSRRHQACGQNEGFGHSFDRIPILAKGVQGPPPTTSTAAVKTNFEDCPPAWEAKIKETASMARNWVNFSIGKIDVVLADPSTVAPKTDEMLRKHFHIGSGGSKEKVFEEVSEIRRNFAKIQAGFAGNLPFECETSCDPKVLGYILGGPFHLFRSFSDIHLCPLWFQDFDLFEQVNTIIHEMAHKFAHRSDEAYEGDEKYDKLAIPDAIHNADSYSAFAQHI